MPWSSHRAGAWSLSVAAALAAGGYGGVGERAGAYGAAEAREPAVEEAAPDQGVLGDQRFAAFRNRAAGYAIELPELWTRRGSLDDVTFEHAGSLVRVIAARSGSGLTIKRAWHELVQLSRSRRTSVVTGRPRRVTVNGLDAIRSRYSTLSPRDPLTGKRVTLEIDRYQIAGPGRVATVELVGPRGLEDTGVRRRVIESFRWL
jgi:hypothetical protein